MLGLTVAAQDNPAQPQSQSQPKEKGPQIKYNYLNVCTPTDAERQEIAAALSRIPARTAFTADFEVTRGSASMENAEPARFVRLRREVGKDSPFTTVQYSLSSDNDKTVEILTLKLKDSKDLLSISLEDQVSTSATAPASVLDVDTPASRIKLERFAKSNLVLSHCSELDQTAYEALFQQATQILANYRKSLGLRGMFRGDLAWLTQPAKPPAKKDKKSPAKPKPASPIPEAKP